MTSCPFYIAFGSVYFLGMFRILWFNMTMSEIVTSVSIVLIFFQCHHCWLLFGFLHHNYPRFLLSIIQCFVFDTLSWPQSYIFVCQLSLCQGWFLTHCQIVREMNWVDFLLGLGICVIIFLFILVLIYFYVTLVVWTYYCSIIWAACSAFALYIFCYAHISPTDNGLWIHYLLLRPLPFYLLWEI